MNPINPKYKHVKAPLLSKEAYLTRLLAGDTNVLSRLLTFSESNNQEKKKIARYVLSKYEDHQSIRIGITGSPGAGKSTFIERLGTFLVEKKHKVAVLAVDPSSTKTHGSVLGDKSRMEILSRLEDAYVRPSPSSSVLGGVNGSTKEAIALCEMAGYDVIIVESVGVGQSEVAISGIVDLTALLLLPGGGDDIQGIKRGVMEMADLVIINKADGDRIQLAQQSKRDFAYALQFFRNDLAGWHTPVVSYSSVGDDTPSKIWQLVEKYIVTSKNAGHFQSKRTKQLRSWLDQSIKESVLRSIYARHNLDQEIDTLYDSVSEGSISPFNVIDEILKLIK